MQEPLQYGPQASGEKNQTDRAEARQQQMGQCKRDTAALSIWRGRWTYGVVEILPGKDKIRQAVYRADSFSDCRSWIYQQDVRRSFRCYRLHDMVMLAYRYSKYATHYK